MSRIRKALEQSKTIREKESGDLSLPEENGDLVLSERERLEHDINELLRRECPEILQSKQKRIQLSYTKTKTITADPETLVCNRLFAHKSEHKVTKQIEILRFQVLKRLEELNANSLMITSLNPNEGKTFISTNLAVSIAQNLDRTVMLIDADLRNRNSRNQGIADVFFNAYKRAGLSDYLLGTARISEVLINPGIPRLTLMPRGQGLLDSPALLESAKMQDLVNDMTSRYSSERIILFDCPSFLSNADALILSRYVDAVLVVVETERTRIDGLKRMLDKLENKQIIGTVMNKFPMSTFQYPVLFGRRRNGRSAKLPWLAQLGGRKRQA